MSAKPILRRALGLGRIAGAAILATTAGAAAQTITPVPLPDPKIPGFAFPEDEDVIVKWTEDNDQAAINKHAWGLWTALTAETDQAFNGQKLLVFETWQTEQDILDGPGLSPRQLLSLRQLQRGDALDQGTETITGFVKYDPSAAKHIEDNDLFSKAALTKLLKSGAKKIPDFPDSAISLKSVFNTISAGSLIDGRYAQIPDWPGPPGSPLPGDDIAFPEQDWNQCVWIDFKNGGGGDGSVDRTCDPSGKSRTAKNTYNLDSFIHFRLDANAARLANARNALRFDRSARRALARGAAAPAAPVTLAAGDVAVLHGMHVTSREITRWTWQTFWWSPDPDDPEFPSSKAIADDRPDQLKGAARNYVHVPSYSMVNPPQPNTGGKNVGNSVYSYNPWLEAGFGPGVLPDSLPGTFNGRPVPNNVGMQSNCMSCHAQANFTTGAPDRPGYAGARYVEIAGPAFKDTLTVDFLWSLANPSR